MSENSNSGISSSVKPLSVQYDALGFEPVESRIAKTVSFFWKVAPLDQWVGLNQEALRGLSGQVAALVGITSSEAEKISIYFADSLTPLVNGKKQITSAICLPLSDRDGKIKECMIVVNRSREAAEYVISDEYMEKKDDQHKSIEGIIHSSVATFLTFESADPYEHIAATLAEELSHAHVALRAGSMEKLATWDKKYLSLLRTRNTATSDLYETDLKEITASRVKLQVLSRLLAQKNPARAAYFQDLFKESLKTGKLVLETLTDIILNEVYIPTGFDPKKI